MKEEIKSNISDKIYPNELVRDLMDINDIIQNKRSELEQGPNLPYRLAASWNVHPTFVQEMITDGRSQDTIIRHLAEIRGDDSNRFRREKIFPSLNQRSRPRVSSVLERYVGKSFLIVGGGNHADSRRNILEDFCFDVGAIPVLLNDAWEDTQLKSLRLSAD